MQRLDARHEAQESLRDVAVGIKEGRLVSSEGERAEVEVHTREGEIWRIVVSPQGWRRTIDEEDSEGKAWHETLHALLSAMSPAYRQNFGDALADKLRALLD